MPDDEEPVPMRLEIAHILFIDIVGYSRLLSDEQVEVLHELNHLVRETEAVRQAEAAGKLTRLPTGDGMALVFTNSVELPVECALELSRALRAKPSLPVRMGIHSGPVHQMEDVNERRNIAGAGINIAQRVMDCGDAGHILVSKRVADDLAQSRRWQPYLHDLGDVEVKHGVVVSVVNLYADVVGNPELPAKVRSSKTSGSRAGDKRSYRPLIYVILLVALLIPVIIFSPAIIHSLKTATSTPTPTPTPPASLGDSIKSMITQRVTEELKKTLPPKESPSVTPSPTPSPP